ncbi:MAG: hypothetical protein KDD11_11420, partial [Acidobacteria bacterium]|nr:hypothetical protein [Acidobacteriota bacterium]
MSSRSENAILPRLHPAAWAFALLLALPVSAPALDPDRAVTQYLLETWNAADGLPGDPVLSISQTSQGYLRLVTEDAALLFDGIRFTASPDRPPPRSAHLPDELQVALPADLAG